MEEKTKLLFKEYLSLSETEKTALEKQISEYKSKDYIGKRTLNESFRKSLGPILGARCGVCGK